MVLKFGTKDLCLSLFGHPAINGLFFLAARDNDDVDGLAGEL